MSAIQIVLLTIAVYAFIKGVIVLLFPTKIREWAIHYTRNNHTIVKVGTVAVLIAAVLLFIAVLID